MIAKLERPESIENLDAILQASGRGDGRAWGPRGRDRSGAGARHPEGDHRPGERGGPPGHHRDRDARLDDGLAPPHARRGERRRERGLRRPPTRSCCRARPPPGSIPSRRCGPWPASSRWAESSPSLLHPVPPPAHEVGVDWVVAQAAVQVAKDVNAAAIVAYSITGSSVELVSKYRPPMPLLGLTPSEQTLLRTALMWGTGAALVPMKESVIDLAAEAERVIVAGDWAERGGPDRDRERRGGGVRCHEPHHGPTGSGTRSARDALLGGDAMARLLVLGGDAAGMSAATHVRREVADAEIVVVERGPYTSYSACGIPYMVSGEVDEPGDLVARTPGAFRESGITVHLHTEAQAIDADRRVVTVRDLERDEEREEPYGRPALRARRPSRAARRPRRRGVRPAAADAGRGGAAARRARRADAPARDVGASRRGRRRRRTTSAWRWPRR